MRAASCFRRLAAAASACLALAGCQHQDGPAASPIAGYSAARNTALTRGAGQYEATLDAELAARNYPTLVRTLEATFSGTNDALRQRTLNWLLLRQENGSTDSVFIGQFYAVGLLVQAAHSQGDARLQWMKDAVTAFYRTTFIMLSEAGQCADPAATDARLGMAGYDMQMFQAIVPRMTPSAKESAARDAFVLAMLTFPIRHPDPWLCSKPGGAPAYRPYAAWIASRRPALQAAEKGVFLTTPPPPVPADGLLAGKNPDVVPLYGR